MCKIRNYFNTLPPTGALAQSIPQFSMSNYVITFNQNLLAGHVLVDISCAFDGVVNYRFSSPSNVQYLRLDEESGSVSLLMDALDIEPGTSSSFVECFDANDPGNSNTAVFEVTRIDQNEFLPRFLHPGLTLSFSEDLSVNSLLIIVNATDEDRGNLGVIEYLILSTSPLVSTLFSIDSESGEMILQAAFDYEAETGFNFLVRAQNTFETSIGRNLAVNIIVEDTDDTAPTFENNEYDIPVHETVMNNIIAGMDYPRPSPGFLVTRCTDPDTPSEQITYSLTSLDDVSPLVLDEATGSFSVTADLDYETRTSYTFQVTCYDNSERNQSNTVGVDVAILPVNEAVPQIRRELTTVFFSETTQVGDVIATGNASLSGVANRFLFTDTDAGSDGNITYSLRDGTPGSGDSNFFSLDLISGDLTITEVLDNDVEGVILIGGLYRRFFVSIIGCDEHPPSDQCNNFDFNVFVLSVNEFNPVIAEERYLLSFPESYSTGGVILTGEQVSCTDQDRGIGELGQNHVRLITTSPTIPDLFHLDAGSGEILLQGSFDYETAQSYGFEIQCYDNGNPSLDDRAVVSIEIEPENDNRPRFDQRSYIFNVSRTTPSNRYVIGMVSATDNDIGLGGDIRYSVQQNGFVDINENGELLLFNSVLNITQTTISFSANVTDSEFTDDVLVVLEITEGNTNRPSFAEGTSTAIQLSELAMLGEVIADLSCSDPDDGANGEIRFSIADGNTDDTFSIDPVTGEITVSRVLVLPQNATIETYTLSLLCEDRGIPVFSDDATIFVSVFKDDSNPPVIANTTINLFVSEDTAPNTVVATVEAIDIDSEQLNYRLENESSAGFFFIDPSTGQLIVGASLDRETIDEYHMTVIVTEIRIVIGPERSDRADINIFIRDVNDNSPACVPSVYNTEVDETASVGEFIVQLQCDDSDLNENGQLSYALLDDFNVLSIDSNTGEVTVGRTLNNTDRTLLPAVVIVSDSGIPDNRQIQVQVTIQIISRNNNQPTFQNLPATVNVSEAQTLGNVFFIVSATDPDRGSFGQVRYSIAGDEQSTFSIISNTGGLSLTSKLNFFSQPVLSLNISARDSDFEVFATLTVVVLDANEFVPVCESTQESFTLAESIEPSGLVFQQLSCSDGDEGSNGQISYTIESGNIGDIFDIRADGTVATIDVLDYETVQEYDLQVSVADGGTPPFSTSVMIRVSVTPVNEFAPIFSQQEYTMDIIEHTAITTAVLEVTATDQDLSSHRDGQITYSLTGQDASFFTVTSRGLIRILSEIDREETGNSLVFTVTATDQAEISRSSSALINVTVIDIDDNSPEFTEDLYVFEVNTEAVSGAEVGSILCTDTDAPSNAQVSYSFMQAGEASSIFNIRNTGTIELTEEIPINRVFTFDVVCTGPAPLNRTDSATVSVRVILNSTISFYPNSTYTVDIDENSPSATELLVINASSTTGAVLSFNQLNLLSQFQVDEATGTVLLMGSLDFETTEFYTLRVEATDNGDPPNTNEAIVQVNVINLNDRTPRITTVPTRIVREEESVNDTQVLDQYLCSDGDRGVLGVTSFRIVSGDTNNVFSITRSGMLLLVGDLDYEAVTDYTLRIVCEDGGEPPLTAAIDVEVEVIPVNDNPPIFNPVEPITLAEDIPVGATVGLPIAATDQDTPPHNVLHYSIHPIDTPFTISPTTGQLTLQSSLDYESVTAYSLSVQADDSGGLSDTEQFEVLSDIINITITVSGVNDNSPKFTDNFYSGTIPESASIGDQAVFGNPVRCIDLDSGPDGDVTISVLGDIPFSVSNNGAITVAEPLDHETTPVYRFTLSCTDSERSTTTFILIFVFDIDEHGPQFVSHAFNFSVSEDDETNTVIGAVEAIDLDGSQAGIVMYEFGDSFNVSFPFAIDEGNGQISLSSSLDFEQEQLYTFLVEAYDTAGNRDTAMVTVEVNNVNDNNPAFTDTLYFLSVRESTPVGTLVGGVVCEDLDDQAEGIPVEYSLGSQAIPFRIEPFSGNILVDGVVDFETTARYMINVFCNDSGNAQVSTDVTIDLEPFNDFAPRFVIPSGNDSVLEVSEDEAVGNTLQRIIAFDQDQGGHNRIEYSIIGGNEANVFTINPNNGFLRLQLQLDREMTSEYVLILRAENIIPIDDPSNSTSLSTVASYRVVVLDVNDNAPEITPENPPLIELIESNTTFVDIAFFECTDADEGRNGMTSFSLSSENPFDSFEITETGVVRTIARVTSSIVLDITCSDSGNPPRSSTVSLAINLVIANEHTPIFSSPSYSFSALENSTLGSIIDCVSATDQDGAENPDGTIRYSLFLESPQNNQSAFSIQEDTGCIFVAAPLSFDTISSYIYRAVATDSSVEPLSSTAQVFISIIDTIAAPPFFLDTPYSQTLFENQESNTLVVQLQCDDIDDSDRVTYSITDGNSDGIFTVDSGTGRVTLSTGRTLDYEANTMHILTAVCTDIHGLRDTTLVTVTVSPINEFTPTFEFGPFEVEENSIPRTEVIQLQYFDDDDGADGEVMFEVIGDILDDAFIVTPAGMIQVNGALDREDIDFYSFEVQISDQSLEPLNRRTRSHLVNITILDQNDNSPIFMSDTYNFGPLEGNETVGFIVGNVTCTDADIGLNSLLTYAIANPSTLFDINADTGEIFVLGDLEQRQLDDIILFVECSDQGVVGLTDTARVLIEIQEVNRNAPQFLNDSYFIEVPEDTVLLDEVILTVEAEDLDDGVNGQVRYSLLDSIDTTFFINEDTGDISILRSLDVETRSFYVLTVIARDGALDSHTQLMSQVDVSIEVTGVNEFTPVCLDPIYVDIINRTTIGPIIDFQCADSDLGIDGELFYQIVEIENSGLFDVSENGFLVIPNPIPPDPTVVQFRLEVLVNDRGSPSFQTTIEVILIYSFDNLDDPTFVSPVYTFNVTEASVVGTIFGSVMALDSDPGLQGRISYSIIGAENFEVDPVSGELFVSQPLDWEDATSHTFSVLAEDGDPLAPLRGEATVRVNVLNENDNLPRCPNVFYTVEIFSNATVGDTVMQLSCEDPDQMPVQYSLVSGQASPFSIERFTGRVYVTGPVVPSINTVLEVRVTGTGGEFTEITISIQAVFVNIQPPMFNEPLFSISVSENTPLLSVVGAIAASDSDSQQTDLTYTIQDLTPPSEFYINPSTGEIILTAPLDFETTQYYTYNVLVMDTGSFDGSNQLMDIATLTVNITNVNDNTPLLSGAGVYGVTIDETTPLGRSVINISCTDNDAPPFASPQLFINLTTSPFTLSANDGLYSIVVANSLSGPDSFVFEVLCRDSGGLTDEGQVYVFVPEPLAPVFTEISYEWPLSETTEAGEEYSNIQATSNDGSMVTYSITAGNDDSVFYIEPDTGVVILVRTLDFEEQTSHGLVIQAADGRGRRSSVLLIVQVLDENDEVPLTPPSALLSVTQNAPIDYPIGALECADQDSNFNSSFSFEPPSNLFSVDDVGIVRLEGVLTETPVYSIPVICYDVNRPGDVSMGIVTIEVEFVNLSPPEFGLSSYSFSISEDASPLTFVGQVSATDGDVGSFGEVSYLITEGNPDRFYIDATTGRIGVLTALDHETTDTYSLTVLAIDGGVSAPAEARLNGSTLVTIRVTDANDNPPLPEQFTYVASIITNHTVLTPVLSVVCSDPDLGDYSVIDYSIEPDTVEDFIIRTDGTVLLAREQTRQRVHNFEVVCRDRGLPSLSSSAQVTVTVDVVSLSAPMFDQEQYNAPIDEDIAIHATVVQVHAVPSDPSIDVVYAIVGGNEAGKFTIDPVSGVVLVRDRLDATQQQEYVLTVSATISGRTAISSLVNVNITVSDLNDNNPVFSSPFYAANVTETSSILTPIVQLLCTDPDLNTDIQYSILYNPDIFNITREGLIYVAGDVDFERNTSHIFEVICSDGGDSPRTARTSVRIDVDPVNEFVPSFSQSQFNFTVSENSFGTQIGILVAADDDAGSHGNMRYFLQDPANNSVVLIDSVSGELIVANNLDYETQRLWDLSVIARDGGGLESHTIVHIDVQNLNDVIPIVSPLATVETISSDSPIGRVIQSFECSDGDGGGTTLTINSGNSLQLFELTPERILVWTGRGDTLDANAVISLTLLCADSQLSTQQATAHIAIRIQVNDAQPPVFSEAVYRRNVSENADIETTVVVVMATSESMNTSYSFFNLPAGFPFEIDSTTGEITLTSSLNRERESLYTFFVGATDVVTSGVGVVLVEVRVEDSNDNPPAIFPSEQTVSLPEDFDTSTEFIRFMCTDSDTGVNGDLTFEISSGNDANTFTLTRVNPQVVAVSLRSMLDFEAVSQYELTIQCSDGGTPSLSDSATLEIVVSGVNEYPPTISGVPYVFQINETAAPGSLVGRVSAFDLDDGEDGVFVYEIEPLLQSAYFTVNNNGEVRTTGLPLNASLTQLLQFQLVVTDTGGAQDNAIVTVEVEDVNTPPIFSEFGTYFVTLTLNQTTPQTILEFFCYDIDAANNSALSLQFANEPSSVAIETNTQQGLLSVSFTLISSLPAGTYDVFLSCSDNGDPLLSTFTTATIQVQGENTPPVFNHGPVFASIMEDAAQGVILTTVNATDAEGNVTYVITAGTGRGTFTIDSRTGDISLFLSLNHEELANYELIVSAFDDSVINPLSARININIDVINVNDEYPIITPPGVEQLVITEAQQLGVPIQTYTCVDPDGTDDITFSISPESPFSVNQNGDILLDTPVDFEVQDSYVLEITCMDSEVRLGSGITLATTAILIVVVVPVNVHAPVFNPPFELFAPEDTIAGTSIGRLNATDMDLRGEITFSSNSHTDIFLVEPLTGDVVVIGTLDYESGNTQYTLSVVASDNDGDMSRTSAAAIVISVTDVNDNTPVCQPFITHQIQTRTYPLTPFAQLSCTDADSDNNSLLMYTFQEPVQSGGDIIVDGRTGEVSLRGNFLTPGAVVFSVVVRDSGDPPLVTQTTIALIIESSDSNALHFNPSQFNISISENTQIGTLIFSGALLRSALVNPASSAVEFRLQQRIENGGSFVIEPTTGDITLIDSSNLDYESNMRTFTMIVDAVVGSAAPEASAVIFLTLEDFNDNPPVFGQPVYIAQILENLPPGIPVVQVTAEDSDSELNGMVNYFISSLDSAVIPFSVDSISGEVTSLVSFDRETNERYSIAITASDSGMPSLNSTVVVTVTILDENDQPPAFRSSIYTVDIDNLTPLNEIILTLEVTDDDANSSLIYELLSTDSEIRSLFIVDVELGLVRRSDIEIPSDHADRYNFTVQVSDGIFEDTTTVVIYIASATSDSVVFSENNIGENYDVRNFLILQDSHIPNATYSVKAGNPFGEFSIDSNGLLTLNTALDRERMAVYVLTIQVEGVVAQDFINVYITVTVKDENDNAPTFVAAEYIFSTVEGTFEEQVSIGTIRATDIDETGSNSAIEYSIIGALIGTEDVFFIQSRTGELFVKTGSTLDRESLNNYTIVVRARDFGEPSALSNSVRVTIVLTDINDNDPEFVPVDVIEYAVLLGKEDVSEDTVLDNIVAILPEGIQKNVDRFEFTDPDLTSSVTASLIDESKNNFYRLAQNSTTNTAVLVTNTKILFSEVTMAIQIALSDERNESNPIIRNISLYFTDTVPGTPPTGPVIPVIPFFQTEVGIAVIAVISMLIFALLFFIFCMCCYCYLRIKREKDPLRNA